MQQLRHDTPLPRPNGRRKRTANAEPARAAPVLTLSVALVRGAALALPAACRSGLSTPSAVHRGTAAMRDDVALHGRALVGIVVGRNGFVYTAVIRAGGICPAYAPAEGECVA